ncbi:unnamed protein product [Choristocarpus tenellus]
MVQLQRTLACWWAILQWLSLTLLLLKVIWSHRVLGASGINGEPYVNADPSLIHRVQDRGGQTENEYILCMLMIVRDEEVNLRLNLPLWRDIIDCYVVGVDDRTKDDTIQVVNAVLPANKSRFIFLYNFEGFGQARNEVLRATRNTFPHATHLLVADADWRPNLDTVDLSQLDLVHRSFQFLIWDRSGHTTRTSSWLMRNEEGLGFKYRIHEVIDSANAKGLLPSKKIGWEVHEVEGNYSWHTNLHGHSRTAEASPRTHSWRQRSARELIISLQRWTSLFGMACSIFRGPLTSTATSRATRLRHAMILFTAVGNMLWKSNSTCYYFIIGILHSIYIYIYIGASTFEKKNSAYHGNRVCVRWTQLMPGVKLHQLD